MRKNGVWMFIIKNDLVLAWVALVTTATLVLVAIGL